MKIAFYRAIAGDWRDKCVAIASVSKYSHVELVFSNDECASSSARDGGIRFKFIDLNSGRWNVFELNLDLDEEAIRYWFHIHKDNTYDWPGAIASAFGIDISDDDKKYCSYACAAALSVNPTITPGGLFRHLKKSGAINE